jgi:branched-chain amino acid transport system permease protein
MKIRIVLPLLVVLYVIVPVLWGGDKYVLSLLVASFTIAGVALAWALLGNLGGMVSFGHAAFFGVGSYTSALLSMKLGLPIFLCILMGGVGATLISTTVLPALRLRGPFFALAILAYSQIFRILATELEGITGGAGGLSSIPVLPKVLGYDFSSKLGGYFVAITIVLFFTWIYHLIRRSYYGIALRAMQESEDATRVVGVNSTLLKAAMLFISAFMTGIFGAFNSHYINFLEPDYAFHSDWTILPVVAAIFGGYRSLTGPLVGAVAIYLIDQSIFKNLIPSGHQFILGALLGAMVLFSPDGLEPFISKKLRWGKRAAH